MKSMNVTKTLFRCNSFSTKKGVKECFFIGISTPGLPLKEALEELASNYLATVQEYGLDITTQQFVRVFISDIYNDEAAFIDSELYSIVSKSSFSIIEQGPLG
ncbi:MAG: hypothetical protein N2053_11675, partial [Chitinispirillaceae bacterium]|nr:hypothetical protein [Chitinispirillaceae bacterium]